MWGAAALWLAAMLGGLLGRLTGLVCLVRLVRRWPAALVAVPAVAIPVLAEAAAVLLLDLPAVQMFLGLLWGRGAGPEAYREGWLGLMESVGRGSRPRRSRWPRAGRGPAGALQALAWLLAMRNWFSLVRLGLLAVGLLLPLLISARMQSLSGSTPSIVFIGAGLTMTMFNYGEQAAALFAADGERAALMLLAGVRPVQWLWGKWLATLPLPLVAAMTTLVWALAGGMAPVQALALGGISLAIAAVCSISC